MTNEQKYAFADWMIHTVIPERLDLLNGELREGTNIHTVISANAAALRALSPIITRADWEANRPQIQSDLSDLSALQNQFGSPATAAALIYIASRPDQPIPDFYASNEAALDDIRKCAAEQSA